MNVLVVYFSKFGNTREVAETIAETLQGAGPARVISSEQLSASDLADADLVVMGSPTHRMNLPEAVRPVFDALPRRVLRDKRVAAFDTSYKMSRWLAHFTAARKLARKLRKLGGKQVVPPETFHVMEREGPLYDGELERAKGWAESIRGQLAARGA
jgi:flavodoxin